MAPWLLGIARFTASGRGSFHALAASTVAGALTTLNDAAANLCMPRTLNFSSFPMPASDDEAVGLGQGGAPSQELLPHDTDDQAKMTPTAVVDRLNRFIVGQEDAKKAVAVAFRNRWRRHRVLPQSLKEEIQPKNILMIGPTGCGKTEIARRLAKLADAPFIKVEATKFTEVGYHGRDVDSIIKDLVENAILLVRQKLRQRSASAIRQVVEGLLLKLIQKQFPAGVRALSALAPDEAAAQNGPSPLSPSTPGAAAADADAAAGPASFQSSSAAQQQLAEAELKERLRNRELDALVLEVEVPQGGGAAGKSPINIDLSSLSGLGGGQMAINLDRVLSGRKEKKRMTLAEARALLEDNEAERMFPAELIAKEAMRLTESDGIVFIDELDKIVPGREAAWRGGDPSSEGVQRDLLPIIEGSTIQTKHGNVNTDHILFICSGAFHSCKPSDLMAELQGRLPIRVELKALGREDFHRILTEPQFNLVKQQQMLLNAEGVDLHFTDAAIHEVAAVAEELNRSLENIGARRLHTVIERIVEPISFSAPDLVAQARAEGKERFSAVVDKEQVLERLAPLLKRQDLSKFII